MVCATDGDGERVGGICGDLPCFRQQAAHHERDLILVSSACTDDGQLHLAAGIFMDLETDGRE